ncbi:MAG: hypothetical protein AB8B71_06495 [Paracoccaceae bacterium]
MLAIGLGVGAAVGAWSARKRKGDLADMLQYAVGYGIAFGLVFFIIGLIIARMG